MVAVFLAFQFKTYLRGQGVTWDQIMENEFDYLSDR